MLSLDSTLTLTRGNPVSLASVLAGLDPGRGSYTGIGIPGHGKQALIGQINYRLGERSARLAFLAPSSFPQSSEFGGLLEDLTYHAGEWGAFNLLAEIEEYNPAFEILRRSGFAVYSWQRIWRLSPPQTNGKNKPCIWQPANELDDNTIRNLYISLVPPIVQSAISLPPGRLQGWVFRQEGEVLGYADGIFGPRGIVVTPLIHPTVDDIEMVLRCLPSALPLMGRPVYLAVRSYQSWLDGTLEDLSAWAAPRQALLVKRLAVMARSAVPVNRMAVIDNVHVKPTASMAGSLDKIHLDPHDTAIQ